MRQDFTLARRAAAAVDAASCYCIDIRVRRVFPACESADASGIFSIEIEFTCQGVRVLQLEILELCFG